MTDSSLSPSNQLADKIARALNEAGLVSAKRVNEVKGKLAAGVAKEQDWRFWIEESLRQPEPEVNQDGQTETH